MEKIPTRNQRQFPRRPLKTRLGVLMGGTYFLSHSIILGEGGMSLYLPSGFKDGQNLVVSFQVPSGDFLILRSEIKSVVNQESPEEWVYGVHFFKVDFNQKRMIRTFVAARVETE